MSVTASPSSKNQQSQLGRALGRVRTAWNQAQTRLGAMVLDDVPIVLLVTATVLVVFGVMMVLSASSVEQISSGAGPYKQATNQAMFAGIGFLIMLIIGYLLPVRFYRNIKVLTAALGVVVLFLIAVMFMGVVVNGNRNWLQLGFFRVQPSEFAKPVMILWLASVYSRQGRIDRGTTGQALYKALFPAILGFGLVVALILSGHDAGTVLIYMLFFAAIFLAAGPSRSTVRIGAAVAAVGALGLVVTSSNRMERILNTFAFWRECQEATCDQANSGLAALATGGFWGVGLGQSRQKYNYLPEAHNDYIFAVVGEELGLVGAIALILLYAALIYCSMRILLRSSDLFIRYATLGIITWIAGQALLNIGMVVGIMPVIGVPLPFISAGGSALISSLIGVGILIAFARQTPLNTIVGEKTSLVNAKSQRHNARRTALARVVAREQIAIAGDPDGTGWTLEKFQNRWNALFHGGSKALPAEHGEKPARSHPAGSSASHTRPSAQAIRKSAMSSSVEDYHNHAPARRSRSASDARPSSRIQQAQQSYQKRNQTNGNTEGDGTANKPAPRVPDRSPSSSEAQTSGKKNYPGSGYQKAVPAQKETKLPEGLRTIRKARNLPNGKTKE